MILTPSPNPPTYNITIIKLLSPSPSSFPFPNFDFRKLSERTLHTNLLIPHRIFFSTIKEITDEEFLKNIIYPPVYIWVIVLGLNSLVFVSGLFGNVVVTWSVIRNREKWTGTNILFSNRAIAK